MAVPFVVAVFAWPRLAPGARHSRPLAPRSVAVAMLAMVPVYFGVRWLLFGGLGRLRMARAPGVAPGPEPAALAAARDVPVAPGLAAGRGVAVALAGRRRRERRRPGVAGPAVRVRLPRGVRADPQHDGHRRLHHGRGRASHVLPDGHGGGRHRHRRRRRGGTRAASGNGGVRRGARGGPDGDVDAPVGVEGGREHHRRVPADAGAGAAAAWRFRCCSIAGDSRTTFAVRGCIARASTRSRNSSSGIGQARGMRPGRGRGRTVTSSPAAGACRRTGGL